MVISSDTHLTGAAVDRARGPERLAMIAAIMVENTSFINEEEWNAMKRNAIQCGETR